METRGAVSKDVLAGKLEDARERTRFLLGPVSEEDLVAQDDQIMSPLIWDYGHIGNYEELWLLHEAHGKVLSKRELYDMYDASLHPREERPSLNLLDRKDADLYLDAVRKAVLETLKDADLGNGDGPPREVSRRADVVVRRGRRGAGGHGRPHGAAPTRDRGATRAAGWRRARVR